MNYETVITIVFFLFLIGVLYRKRKELSIQKIIFPVLYMFILRTKWGIALMDKWAKKYPRFMKHSSFVGIVVGFIGMVVIAVTLVKNFFDFFAKPDIAAGVQLVLPFEVKGAIHVPILYWIICIFIIAIVHEFAHGVIARAYNLPVKSSGLAFLCIFIPIIPAAFVEPDEKKLKKATLKAQLSVYAAGPFSNVILAAICLALLVYAIAPAAGSLYQENGVELTGVTDGFPAHESGMMRGERIVAIDDVEIFTVDEFIASLNESVPGTGLSVTAIDEDGEKKVYTPSLTQHPQNDERGYLGVQVAQSSEIKPAVEEKWGTLFPKFAIWFVGLFYWMFLLNLGIGLFNLAPLGPLDGGRMINCVLLKYFKKEKAMVWFKYISLIFLALILIPLLLGFFR